ncbi:FecCD family ABC transporter permease [Microbacterium sp. No. 7]|uniref:FecCD family ABC transporter permease n=1 Tax=Microbacterium sp. No. 7 TaxID=1714373 RepID=UPI003FA5D832
MGREGPAAPPGTTPFETGVHEQPGAAPRAPRTRRAVGLAIALAALVALMLLSVAVGSKNIPLDGVLHGLFAYTGEGDDFVIWDLRVPRTVTGIVVGAALGLAGALIQALTRNPLADPGILGVNAGAMLFVALGVAVLGVSSIQGYIWFALAGALLVTVAVFAIGAAGRSGVDPLRLTLAGMAVGAALQGVVTGLMLLNTEAFNTMRTWNAGTLVGRGFDVLLPVLPFLGVGVLIAAGVAASLNAIALGDDLARSLGIRIGRIRVLTVVAVTLLAGGATAIAGPIGFVGLMIPHIARWITGPDQRWILAYTLVLAPSLVLASDVLGRVVMSPGELPVGVVTAFVGAPVLVVLVRRRKASGL